MDLPMILPKGERERWMEYTHGVPGLALSLFLGRRWVVGWCAHIALDTLSHSDGGATGKSRMVWLP